MYFSCMEQASNGAEDDTVAIVEREFGVMVMNMEQFKQRIANSRMDRIALMVLGTLSNCGPSRLTTLAERTGFDASTMSRQVADLEQAGLLKPTTDPDDRRAALLEATPEGQEMMARLASGRRKRIERLVSEWGAKDIQTLGRMLKKLNESLEKYGEQNALELEQELNNG
jgi:DNA-binding MarR family transcriptional regulator